MILIIETTIGIIISILGADAGAGPRVEGPPMGVCVCVCVCIYIYIYIYTYVGIPKYLYVIYRYT